MADINEIKEKVMNTIGSVADMTKDAAAKTADKAKSVARIAKLSMEINGERDAVKKAYLEIGKLYYETHKGDPEGFFTQLCEEVGIADSNISEKEAEIAALKAALYERDSEGVDVEFVEITDCDDEDGDCCGAGEDCCGHKPEDEECGCGCEEHSKKTSEKVQESINEIREKVTDVVNDVLSGMPEKAAEVRERMSEVFAAMPDKASEIKDKIIDAAGEVADAVKGVISDITDKKDDGGDL